MSTRPGGAMTTCPPDSSGTHSSYVEASNDSGEWASTRRCAAPKAVSRASAATLACVTPMPFGSPVEPEVYITYASWSGAHGGYGTGPAGSPSAGALASSTGTGEVRTASWQAVAGSASSRRAPVRSSIQCSRATGNPSPSGT